MKPRFYFLYVLLFSLSACTTSNKTSQKEQDFQFNADKINGISMVSPNTDLLQEDFEALSPYHFDWTAISPFAFVEKDKPNVRYNLKWQWKSETPEGVALAIKNAKAAGIKVMLKPQLWGHDLFTGHITYKTDSLWQIFEEDYKNYLLTMAHIADTCEVELLCIGTELAGFVQERPDFWSSLIQEIRRIYDGPLTYAENWDSYANVPFGGTLIT